MVSKGLLHHHHHEGRRGSGWMAEEQQRRQAVPYTTALYGETCLKDHLRNRDNLGIKDSYSTPVPRSIRDIEIDLRNKTTSEFRTLFHSPLGVPNSQVSLYM